MDELEQNYEFLERFDLRIGDVIDISIAKNQLKTNLIILKNAEITPFFDSLPIIKNNLKNILNHCETPKKKVFLKSDELLKLMEYGFNDLIPDSAFTGLEFDKAGVRYKILGYSPTDKTGILFKKLDGKILLVINFPKHPGKLLWNVKGEYNADKVGLTQCLADLHSSSSTVYTTSAVME